MINFLRRNLFDFENVEARRHALLSLLVVAFVSPNVPMPSPLPALRIEQAFLGVLLPSLALFYWRRPALRKPMWLDWAFLALILALTASAIAAPQITSHSTYSLRDPFEIARPVEYWLMFRIAYAVPPSERAERGVSTILLWAPIGIGLFSVVQYLNVGQFNEWVTDIWATQHNLDGVTTRSRVVGTVGNANYVGILAALLLAFALALVLLRHPRPGRTMWLIVGSTLMATTVIVMSQSRTSIAAALGAFGLGIIFVAATWRGRANYVAAIGLFLGAVVLSVTFVEIVPPQLGAFHDRFMPSTLSDESSVTIRLSRWRALLAGFFHDKPDFCSGQKLDAKITNGHRPTGNVGVPPATSDASARDNERKTAVRALSRGVIDYYCDHDRWPYNVGSLQAALVPKYMSSWPQDPSTGADLQTYIASDGFMVGAMLENPADTEGPVFALGTVPNIVVNPSFEDGKGSPSRWIAAEEQGGRSSVIMELHDDGLFGQRALHANLNPKGSLFQSVVFEFPYNRPWTATVWARSDSGKDESVLLYLIAVLARGGYIDPLAKQTVLLPADGRWVPVSLTFNSPADDRMYVLRYTIQSVSGDANIKLALDGVTVNEGTFAPTFTWVRDVDPSRLKPEDAPGFSDSPILGVGPRKDFQTGSFDNEYALFLNRFGVVGTTCYLGLFGSAFVVAYQARKSARRTVLVLSLAMMVFSVALWAFNFAAGSYYNFQIMAIYWMLVGFVARSRPGDSVLEEG